MSSLPISLLNISQDLISHILQFLDVPDVLNLSTTNKTLTYLLDDQVIWNNQLKTYVDLDLINIEALQSFNSKQAKLNTKAITKEVYLKFAQIRSSLAKIISKVEPELDSKAFVNRIFKYNTTYRSRIEEILKDNFSTLDLYSYLLFRSMDGQNNITEFPQEVCFFGGHYYYGKFFEFEFLPLKKSTVKFLKCQNIFTLAYNSSNGLRYCIDFENILQFGHGAVFSPLLESRPNQAGIQSAIVYIEAPNVLEFLKKRTQCTFNPRKNLLDLFDTACNPQVYAISEGIKVGISTFFNPWEMSSNNFVFAYQVRISSTNDIKKKWKFRQRKWVIQDGTQKRELLQTGLSGKFPQIYHTQRPVIFESCFYVSNLDSEVKGYFYFTSDDQPEQEIAIEISNLKLSFPNGSALIEYTHEPKDIKILINKTDYCQVIESDHN